jgi:hypothetical protein
MRHILPLVAVGLLGFLAWGCAQSARSPAKAQAYLETDISRLKEAPPDVHAMVAQAPAAAPPPAGGGGQPAPAQGKPLSRKIIYNADVKVVVPDLSAAEQQLLQLVKDRNGFVAQSEILGSAGSPRQGHWRLRVPVDQVQACVEAIVKLGVPEKNSLDSKDVTEEFYDLEARIKNMKVEEGRLQGYLEDKKAVSKLEDILAIERELNRVRGQVEQAEGHLRMLANLSDLATLDVTLREVKDYVPPQAPTFGTEIAGTFFGSFDALTQVGKALLLVLVALVPWLPVIAVVAVPIWLLVRWALRHSQPPAAVTVVPTPEPPAG